MLTPPTLVASMDGKETVTERYAAVSRVYMSLIATALRDGLYDPLSQLRVWGPQADRVFPSPREGGSAEGLPLACHPSGSSRLLSATAAEITALEEGSSQCHGCFRLTSTAQSNIYQGLPTEVGNSVAGKVRRLRQAEGVTKMARSEDGAV